MNLVFNELSLKDIPESRECGAQLFEEFVKTYSRAIQDDVGISRDIISTIDLNTIEISHNYYVAEWRNQLGIDRDIQRVFKRMCDRQQLEPVNEYDFEISCEAGVGEGLLIAYQDDMLLISLNTNPCWSKYVLECDYYELEQDSTAKIFVHNICSVEDIVSNLGDILEWTKREVNVCSSAEELISRIENLYPSLMFHKTALKQIEQQLERKHVPVVCRKLYELEKYFLDWDGKAFDESRFPNRSVSVESKETLRRFEDAHKYVFEDGKVVIVSYHMRYTGNVPGRIYFYPDNELKTARICSLTTKLPTVKNPKEKV